MLAEPEWGFNLSAGSSVSKQNGHKLAFGSWNERGSRMCVWQGWGLLGSQQGAYTALRDEWTGAPSITKVTNLGN